MSFLDILEPVYSMLPEVKTPEVQPTLKKKLMWSALVLLIFFIMGNIQVIGLSAASAGGLQHLQMILASNVGTLITVGIGPIVLASIILQLFVGGGIIEIDLSNAKDKARFTAMQKLLAIVLCFFEAAAYVFGGLLTPTPGMLVWVILQAAFGSIILLYLDEVVSKYGVGSGIGLFIAGGVGAQIFWLIFNPFNGLPTPVINFFGTEPTGAQGFLFKFINNLGISGPFAVIVQYVLPIVFAVLIFLMVVFAEGMYINIPITMGRRGTGGRYPVKFLYVSNMPVILAVALFLNIRLWATLTTKIPLLGLLLEKAAIMVEAPRLLLERILFEGISPAILEQMLQSVVRLQFVGLGGDILHALIYVIILVVVCIIFGIFWVEMAGQGPEAIAEQLQKSGMYIPGFRRDPRIVRKILERYVPPITILGSAFVGLLAGISDLTGAVGSGIGILLTVGIVYALYEELARLQLMELHPMLGKLLG